MPSFDEGGSNRAVDPNQIEGFQGEIVRKPKPLASTEVLNKLWMRLSLAFVGSTFDTQKGFYFILKSGSRRVRPPIRKGHFRGSANCMFVQNSANI